MNEIGFKLHLLPTGTSNKENIYEENRSETICPSYKKPLSSSVQRILKEKSAGSVIFKRPYVISESLEHSRKWFEMEIKSQLDRGGLFEDPFFPADDTSINSSRSGSSKYQWLRPTQLKDHPLFVADGISRFDVQQGELGDCWFLAAVASLSLHQNLFNEVVPPGQCFIPSTNGRPTHRMGFAYVGMFWFRFWRFGQWVDVVVDDRIPTVNHRLTFMHSSDSNEFWSALLEKAYAKMIGSYDLLRGGTTAEAMEDFTGGMTELIDLGPKAPKNLFDIMCRSQLRCSLMASSIDASPDQVEADGPLGLYLGHAYSITDVKIVRDSRSNKVKLVRLRNPWGNDREWRGPWSDKSREWNMISPEERTRIGLTFENDGEFWMSFSDFVEYFSRLELCHLSPEFDALPTANAPRRRWEMTRHEGEWLRHSTAGGCRNFADTFHMNPQFRVDVEDPDETDDDPTGTIVVGLMQMGMREKKRLPHTIGYSIYKFPCDAPIGALLTKMFFLTTQSTTRSPLFINMREVCGRHKLSPGSYAIIPSTYEPNEEAKFLLRIFSEKAYRASELNDGISIEIGSLVPSPTAPPDDKLLTQLRSAFQAIAGLSGDIEAVELQDILNVTFKRKGVNFDGFSLETVRSMVALMDVDTSGTLGFDEFKTLWFELRLWQTVFKLYDPDNRGSLKAFELRDVLGKAGIHVSNEIFKAIVCRYANKGMIAFDDYILLVVRLITVFEKFKERTLPGEARAAFTADEFLRCVLYT